MRFFMLAFFWLQVFIYIFVFHYSFQEKHKEYRHIAEMYNSQRQACKSSVERQLKKLKLLKTALQR